MAIKYLSSVDLLVTSSILKTDSNGVIVAAVAGTDYLTSINSSMITTALGYTPVPTTRTLTINGTTYDLSANRSWTVTTAETDTLATVTTRGNVTTNTIDVGGAKSDYFTLDIAATPTPATGMFTWNANDDTANLQLASGASLQLGQEQHWYVKNSTGSTIPNGTVVMAVGTDGNSGHILVSPMIADGSVEERYVLGIATSAITNGGFGHVTSFGKVRGINTTGFTEGAVLYCDPVNPGGLTETQPIAPNLNIPLAFVVSSAVSGILAARVTPGNHLGELHDVYQSSASTGQLLRYNTNRWENWTPNYLTSINSSMVTTALGYTPVTNARTLTINGTAFDLSANRSWTISTITGNAGSATVLQTARTFTIGSTGKTFNGGANVSWTLAEIGALGATAKAADSELLDGINSTSFLRSDAADTATGEILFDAGFKSDAILLNGAQNFDNISRSGFYNLYNTNTGSTNSPGFPFGTMLVVGSNKESQSFGFQLAHERLNTAGGLRVRGMNDTGSAWSAWATVWTSLDFANNSANWNTAFGWGNHAGLYLPLSGGTVTGSIVNSGSATSFRNRIGIGDGNGTPYTNTGSPGVWLSYNGASTQFMGAENTTSWGVYINSDWRMRVSSGGVVTATSFTGSLTGNATTATTLQTARSINGTSFNGSADITTTNWGTTRTITIGNTSKSVNGSGNVSWSLGEIQAEYQVPLNTLRNNLGSPTVREAALFHGQFNNKFRFLAPTLQEESTDGTTWVTSTRASANALADIMIGEGQSSNITAIPSAAVGTFGGYRLTWSVVGQTGYVFLNALYVWNSTNGNTVNITIERFHNTTGWETVCGPLATSNWPGHAYIPHSDIYYSNAATQYSQVRVTFTSTHNTNTNAFNIYGIEWFGGYPQGRRNVESYDRDKNVFFPNAIQGSRLVSTVATGTPPLNVSSTTAVGNLNADMVDGYHSSSLWRADGGVWNPGANITLGQTANNQEWSFDITRNGYTGGYWHVWDSANSTMLKVDAVTGKVSAPYNFVGNLEGNATTATTATTTTGNAGTATTLQNARTLTIGNTGKTFNGSANVSWSLAEIGAQAAGSYAAAAHTHVWTDITNRPTTVSFFTNDSGYITSSGEINRAFRGIIEDTRSAQRTPNNYDDYRTSWEFTNQITGISDWHTAMTLQGWHDGYSAWQIIGPASTSAHENWYLRSGINTSWNSLRTIIHSGNIGSQSVSYADESGYSASSGSVEWGNVQNKPATFAPSAHTHDDRYYTETESDARFLNTSGDTSTGMQVFYTSLTNNDDWQNSPISIMERGQVGSGQSAAQYAPNLNFHWGGRASKSLWLDSSGVLRFGEYNASGIPQTDGTISAATFSGALSGNATTATTLATARTLTIGGTGKTFNGSANVSWTLAEIGAQAAGSYAAASHTHAISDVTGLQTALDGKAASSHTHTIANVTGLQTALDGKQAAGSYLTTSGKAADSELLDGIDSPRFIFGESGRRKGTNLITDWNQTTHQDVAFLSSENGTTNAPTTDYTYGIQYSFHRSGAGYRTQIVTSLYGDSSIWIRNSRDADVWTSWKRLWHTGDFTSTNVSNWNTAFGWGNHASAGYQAAATAITTSNIGSQSVNYAASAGTADNIDGVAFRNTGSNSAVNADTLNSNGITYYTSGVTNFSGNATDGALYSQAYSSSWQHQIAGDYRSGQIALRGKNNGTWQAWRTVLDTTNAAFAANMNQNVRTNSSPTFSGINSTGFLYMPNDIPVVFGSTASIEGNTSSVTIRVASAVRGVFNNTGGLYLTGDAGTNTGGLRLKNSSGTESPAMWVQSNNRIIISNANFAGVTIVTSTRINTSLGVNVDASATAGRIDAANDIVAYSSSDERLKENITPINNALGKVKSLTGVEFDWKPEHKDAHGYEGHDTGVIAQQVQEVMPTAVRTNDTGFLAVRYEKLIGVLIEGMKEQQAQIEELKAKLDGLTK